MDELISIIVPVYNLESYLERSIGSILHQTYGNLEVIAVDDGSSDYSYSVLTRISSEDARLRILHQENQGVTQARIAGLSVAKGEWIGFVDGDDEVEPEMFDRLLQNAKTYNADISHCGYQMVFPNRVDYYYNSGRFLKQSSQEATKDLLTGTFEPGLWNKIFRKSLLMNMIRDNLMDQTIKINEDLLMNYYLFRMAKQIVYEDFCPYHYVVREGSAAKSTMRAVAIRDPIRVQRILYESTKDDPELHSICIRNTAETLTRMASKSSRGANEDVRDCILEAREQLKAFLPQLRGTPRALRLKARWASVSPGTYRLVRDIYGEWTGNKHKYDIK